MTTLKIFTTHNDLPADVRTKMIDLLNQELADCFDLFSQTKQAHWNVKGMQFFPLHELFDQIAESLEDHVDTIAERATALGGLAQGTARMAAANSRLPEFSNDLSGSQAYVETLTDRVGRFAKTVRAAIDTAAAAGDQGTADLFTEVSRSVDKHLWFLEAHIQE